MEETRTRTRPGIVGQIAHASALADAAVGQANAEELDASVGAGPGVVAIVAAMRAAPRHGGIGSDWIGGFGLVGSELHDPEGWAWRQKRQTEEQVEVVDDYEEYKPRRRRRR